MSPNLTPMLPNLIWAFAHTCNEQSDVEAGRGYEKLA